MTNFSDIKADYEDFSRRAQDAWVDYYKNAEASLLAYAGRTWTQQEIDRLQHENRTADEFPIIRSKVNFFSGYARDNMKSTIVGPVENSDQYTADQLSEVMRYVYEKADINSIQLNAFDDCLKTGMALVGIYLDYSHDPIHGDIKVYKRSYNSFMIDPDFERMDLSDAAEVSIRDFVTREDAKALLPMIDPKVIDDAPAYSTDNKYKYLRNNRYFMQRSDLLAYDQYFKKISKEVVEIVDLDTGIATTWDEDDKELLDEKLAFARQLGLNVEVRKRTKQTIELNIFLTNEPVYTGPDQLGLDDYPFTLYLCHFEAQLSNFALKVQGLPLSLIDTQRAFNKRQIRKMDVMDTAINTGGLYRVGDIDPRDIKRTGAGVFVPVDSEKPFGEIFQPFQQGQIPSGWLEETQYLQSLAFDIVGVNESLLGTDEGGNTQVSGRLAEVRAANGVRANRSLFDNFERSQKNLGQKLLRTIQKYYGPGKIQRILNKEPSPQFFNQEFDRYDAVIKQAVRSQTQKDAFYFELLNLVQIYGPERIPLSLIMENLPMEGASKIQEVIQQQEEMQKLAEVEQQKEKQRAARLQDSITEENIALAQERRARVISDIGLAQERQSQIRSNVAKSNLDQAKTLAEIEKLKDEDLMQLLTFLDFLRQRELQDQQQQFEQSLAVQNVYEQETEPQGSISTEPQPLGGQ